MVVLYVCMFDECTHAFKSIIFIIPSHVRRMHDYSHLEGMSDRFKNVSVPEPDLLGPLLASLVIPVRLIY